jgi:hypothetical protein
MLEMFKKKEPKVAAKPAQASAGMGKPAAEGAK